jgi:hypothetical protein
LGFDEWSFNAPSSDNSGGGVVGILLRGPFDSDEASAAPVDLNMAEGLVSLGLNVIDGFELGAGVRGRARYTGSDSERILLLVAHARYEAPVISERVWAFVEGWNSLAGDASAPSGSASGKGGLVGVVAALGPLAVRLSFAADAARYANAARRDELQSFALGLGYNLR